MSYFVPGMGRLDAAAFVTFWGFNAIAALLFGLLAQATRSREKEPATARRAVGAATFAFLMALAAGPLGMELAAGDWISQQSWVWAVYAVPALGAFGIAATAWWFGFGIGGRTAVRRWVPAVLLTVGGIATVVVDHLVLAGTYPEIHLFLWGAAVVLCTLGLVRAAGFLPRKLVTAVGVLGLLFSVAGAVAWWNASMPVRAAYTLGAPMANNLAQRTMAAVENEFVTRVLDGLDPTAGSFVAPAFDPPGAPPKNVVFVTVDTLRADALDPSKNVHEPKYLDANSTPFLDEFAKRSVIARSAYAQSSATKRSMPTMFRSLEAHENVYDLGEPLGTAMARTGRETGAVVNNLFLEPRRKATQSLLWGFDVVSVHEKKDQRDIVDQVRGQLDAFGDQPFFLWVHFYCMHIPGYDDSGMLPENGNHEVAYRASLKWLDARMKELVGELEGRGLMDETVLVLAADHGEGLGANGQKAHGATVFEEEIRTPLYFWVPGAPPRVLEQTVGNIDIVPTLYDLLEIPPSPVHRGRSLAPQIFGAELASGSYYFEDIGGDIRGVVRGANKLIYQQKNDVFLRFDLAEDPTEDHNEFDPDGAVDIELLADLHRHAPELAKGAGGAEDRIVTLLRRVDPAAPGEALGVLVDLALAVDARDAVDPLVAIFAGSRDDRVKLTVLRGLSKLSRGRAQELVEEHLASLPPAQEAEFVHGLADIDFGEVSLSGVSPRLLRANSDALYFAWLRLFSRWNRPAVVPFLLALRGQEGWEGRSPVLLERYAELAGDARGKLAERVRLAEAVRGLLSHRSPRVRSAAAEGLTGLRDPKSVPALKQMMKSENLRDVQAAMHALSVLDPEGSAELIVAAGSEPILTLDTIKALERAGSTKALPYLEKIRKTHYNWIIRRHAKEAVEKIEKRNAPKSKKKEKK